MRTSLKPLGEMIAVAILAAAATMALATSTPAQARQAEASAPAQAQPAAAPPSESVEQANQRLAQVTRDRAVVAQEFAASEAVCSEKFFVNYCLDKAKEKRRVDLARLRAIEVEAEHFKRVESVRERDADLAERVRKDAEELARREALPPKEAKVVEPPRAAPKGPRVADREADNAARLKREQAATAAGAEQRAANVAAFEKKQADAERRQADVAKRVAETQRKQAAREESERKKAAAAAAKAAADAAAKK